MCRTKMYEDASDLSATSLAWRARKIWRTTRHTEKQAALYTAADRRPTNQVKVAFHDADSDILADILATIVARTLSLPQK